MDTSSVVMTVIVLGLTNTKTVSITAVRDPVSSSMFTKHAGMACVYILGTERCRHMMGLQKANLAMLTCASVNLTMKAFVKTKWWFLLGKTIFALLFAIPIHKTWPNKINQ